MHFSDFILNLAMNAKYNIQKISGSPPINVDCLIPTLNYGLTAGWNYFFTILTAVWQSGATT